MHPGISIPPQFKSAETCSGRSFPRTYHTYVPFLRSFFLTDYGEQSLALGRPPAIHLSYVDCEYPIDDEENINEAGEIQSGCKYILCQCLSAFPDGYPKFGG